MASAADRTGTLGSVSIRLAPDVLPEERYQRRYVPVEPKSQEIPGTGGDKIAPESTIATWHIDDWSAGEGDLRWRQGSKRYNKSSGVHPMSDGSGLRQGVNYYEAADALGGDFNRGGIIVRGAGRLLAADDFNDDLYYYDDPNDEWVKLWDISTGSGLVISVAAVDNDAAFVAAGTDIRKVTSSTKAVHYSGWTGGALMVSYQGILYGLEGNDLYSIDVSAASTRTQKADIVGTIDREGDIVNRMTVSDVGPVWLVPLDDGTTYIYEYNQASDTSYPVGMLPKDTQPYSILFYSGIYFVGFRYAINHAGAGDAYVYYKNGGQQGVAGPLRTAGTGASEEVTVAGVVGDQIMVTWDDNLWAYDLSSGGIYLLAEAAIGLITTAITVGNTVYVGSGSVEQLVVTDRVLSEESLDTGRHDFGYLGLQKTLQSVTIRCEQNLASSQTVGLKYAVDGGSFATATGTISSGESSKTWTISTNASTVRGVDFELQLLITGSNSGTKIISVTAEATGSEDRVEWVLQLDLSDNNIQQGQATLDGLKALKTNHAVVKFTDPWTVLGHTAAETFDVTVEDVILPHSLPGGTPKATVLLRSAGTV